MKKLFIGAVVAATIAASGISYAARDTIQTVGSSTVFPFATTVAENFGKVTGYGSPVIESTGTGGGMKLFCAGVGIEHPDITNASRAIKSSEVENCTANGVTPIEVKIGYDGIVLGNSVNGDQLDLTVDQMYRATAEEIYINGEFVANPYKTWSDIDPSLPAYEIEVMGPPPTSGTRDAYIELVQHAACNALGVDKKLIKARCSSVREDGAYIEAGENDNLIVQKLNSDSQRFGIFGFSFLDNNRDSVQGVTVSGVAPEFDAISSGEYPVSRSLFFYVKKEHVGVVPGLREYVEYFISDAMIGEYGATVDKGLIPLPADEYAAMVKRVTGELN